MYISTSILRVDISDLANLSVYGLNHFLDHLRQFYFYFHFFLSILLLIMCLWGLPYSELPAQKETIFLFLSFFYLLSTFLLQSGITVTFFCLFLLFFPLFPFSFLFVWWLIFASQPPFTPSPSPSLQLPFSHQLFLQLKSMMSSC